MPVRAKTDDVVALYKGLCKKIAPDMVEHLLVAREEYVSHGGTAELPEELAQRAQEQQTKQAGLFQRPLIILNRRRGDGQGDRPVAFVSHPVFYLVL